MCLPNSTQLSGTVEGQVYILVLTLDRLLHIDSISERLPFWSTFIKVTHHCALCSICTIRKQKTNTTTNTVHEFCSLYIECTNLYAS